MINTPSIPNNRSYEPALKVGGVVTLLPAVFFLVNSIWPNLLSDDVQNAITGVAVILIPIITSLVIRSKVWSPGNVQALLDRSVREAKLKETDRLRGLNALNAITKPKSDKD